MPNILPMEMVVVGAGFGVLCLAPAILAWVEAARRRRAERAAHAIAVALPTVDASGVELGLSARDDARLVPEEHPTPEPSRVLMEVPPLPIAVPTATEPVVAEPGMVTPYSTPFAAQPSPTAAESAGAPSVESGGRSYEFRLQDLRRARILDWPPAAIREDAERNQSWQEGQRIASAHQTQINATTFTASYMPQSSCFGAAEAVGTRVRLRFLLFRDLWPVHENQAIAEAVFEIDGPGNEIRSWLEPHRGSAS